MIALPALINLGRIQEQAIIRPVAGAFGSQGMGLPEKSSPFLAHTRQNSAVNREFCVSDGQDLCPDIGLVQSDNP